MIDTALLQYFGYITCHLGESQAIGNLGGSLIWDMGMPDFWDCSSLCLFLAHFFRNPKFRNKNVVNGVSSL
jgi:hypothetical protein